MLIKIYLSVCLQVCNTHELKPRCGRQGVLEVQKDALLRCLARARCTSELFAALLGGRMSGWQGVQGTPTQYMPLFTRPSTTRLVDLPLVQGSVSIHRHAENLCYPVLHPDRTKEMWVTLNPNNTSPSRHQGLPSWGDGVPPGFCCCGRPGAGLLPTCSVAPVLPGLITFQAFHCFRFGEKQIDL